MKRERAVKRKVMTTRHAVSLPKEAMKVLNVCIGEYVNVVIEDNNKVYIEKYKEE